MGTPGSPSSEDNEGSFGKAKAQLWVINDALGYRDNGGGASERRMGGAHSELETTPGGVHIKTAKRGKKRIK